MIISKCVQNTDAEYKVLQAVKKNDKFADLCNEQRKIRKLPYVVVCHYCVERNTNYFALRFGRAIKYIIINILNSSLDLF
jgi:hypothetical protein